MKRNRLHAGIVLAAGLLFVMGGPSAIANGPTPRATDSTAAFSSVLRSALAEPDDLERLRRLLGLVEQLDAAKAEAGAVVFDKHLGLVGEAEIRLFFSAWARFDPEAALAHAHEWRADARDVAVSATIRTWALRAPDQARAVADEIFAQHPTLRLSTIRALVSGWAHSGQEGLIAYVVAQPHHLRAPGNVAMVQAQAHRLDAEAFRAWAQAAVHYVATESQDPEFARGVFRRVSRALGRQDPIELARWTESHAGQAYAEDGARLTMQYFLPHDPAAALAWVEGADPAVREHAIRIALRIWLRGVPAEATAWVESTPGTAVDDTVHDVYAQMLAQRGDPEAGIAWTTNIADETRRLAALQSVAGIWYGRDEAAAEAWLLESPLDAEARQAARGAAAAEAAEKRGRPVLRKAN